MTLTRRVCVCLSVLTRRSYEDRIAEQKSAIDILTVLYVNSQEVGRQDQGNSGKSTPNPSRVLKSALKGFRNVAQTATTGLGIIASEIANERVLQPNSPISRVTSTLSSANKSKQLARRIFYSFSSDSETMRIEGETSRAGYPFQSGQTTHSVPLTFFADIQLFFPSYEAARDAFEFFDRDGNGDATLEEMEMALVELHRERLALAASMKDLDSAVGRLDAILMGIFYIVAVSSIPAVLRNPPCRLSVSEFLGRLRRAFLDFHYAWFVGHRLQHPLDLCRHIHVGCLSYLATPTQPC